MTPLFESRAITSGWPNLRAGDGLTNVQLRPLVASLLGASYTAGQMGYDLRRLIRKGLVGLLERQNPYVLTPYGRRVDLF